jgi:hypothetical protein
MLNVQKNVRTKIVIRLKLESVKIGVEINSNIQRNNDLKSKAMFKKKLEIDEKHI